MSITSSSIVFGRAGARGRAKTCPERTKLSFVVRAFRPGQVGGHQDENASVGETVKSDNFYDEQMTIRLEKEGLDRLVMYASELAAVLGLHKYQPQPDAFAQLWQRTCPQMYFEAAKRARVKLETKEESLKRLAQDQGVAQQLSSALEFSARSTSRHSVQKLKEQAEEAIEQQAVGSAAERQISNILDDVPAPLRQDVLSAVTNKELSSEERARDIKEHLGASPLVLQEVSHALAQDSLLKTELGNAVTRELYTGHGTRSENVAIRQYEVQTGARVLEDPQFRLTEVAQFGECGAVFVGGRVDGLAHVAASQGPKSDGEDGADAPTQIQLEDCRIVEVKNRMRRHFKMIPQYEKVQVQAYLRIWDVQEGHLVESLRGGRLAPTRSNVQIGQEAGNDEVLLNIIPFKQDTFFWDTKVLPRVLRVASALQALCRDPDLQVAYFKCQEDIHRCKWLETVLASGDKFNLEMAACPSDMHGGSLNDSPRTSSRDTRAGSHLLEDMTVKELRRLCKDNNWAGYSTMRKHELLRHIQENMS
ncbi:hypothetical protein CYMTET_5395 [Cymbomonas tetramitiformis]|uniref:Uncharacterized protein n=1 Tax=Cymbomonas tetramitiformis TaxID=36881 RepID=A0AAE0LJE9_9CHLO|nr:hypothetical protein CYMTET_5395 [Cymbomonas tetramitiformis]